jgi:hypothetical protein
MRPSGPSHSYGYAPDPGRGSTFGGTGTDGVANSQVATTQILHEDAKWKELLSGRLLEITQTGNPIDKFNLLGSLLIAGHLSCTDVNVNNATVEGVLTSKPYFCRLWNSTNISTSNAIATAMTFDTERINIGGMHSLITNTSRITAPSNGIMLFGGGVIWDNNATGIRQLFAQINGSNIVASTLSTPGAAQTPHFLTAGAYPMVAGDYLEIFANQTSTTTLNVLSGSNYSPQFWGLLIPTA